MVSKYQKWATGLELLLSGSFIIASLIIGQVWTEVLQIQGYLKTFLSYAVYFPTFCLSVHLILSYIQIKDFGSFFRARLHTIFLLGLMLIIWGDVKFTFLFALAHLVLSLFFSPRLKSQAHKEQSSSIGIIARLKLQPAQLVLLTFILLILIGSAFLALPFSVKPGEELSLADAMFMATSATCVTGLATVSLVDQFSVFGQIIILLLIQVGGLGFMTLSTSLTIFVGRSLDMKEKLVMQDLLEVTSQEDLIGMVVNIIKYTFFIELWGSLVLTGAFLYQGHSITRAVFYGVFHSVSAFCNAGFALFSNSLENFATDPIVSGVVMVLIVLGGIGFIVIRELEMVFRGRVKANNISVHSKIVVITTLFLIISGAVFIFFGEYMASLKDYSLGDKALLSLFHSITTRTAGFNTLPMTSFQAYTVYFMILLMFVGASPGSTGGGVKTTTFAILLESVRATLSGRNQVSFFNRTIPSEIVVKTTALIIVSAITVSFYILVLVNLEPNLDFMALFFEVISAFATVGLSLGITPELSQASKLVLVSLMFIGRVGALTLVVAIGQKGSGSTRVKYPKGRIMIG